MNYRNLGADLLLVVALAAIAAWPLASLAAEEGEAKENSCTAGKCHADLLKPAHVHPVAADGCDACHEAVETQHPVKGQKTFKLADKVPALCYTCHDSFGQKAVVHPPVADGDCTGCHNPHASNQPKLLVDEMRNLCETCHDAIKAKELHGPVSTGDCTACHNPHESDNKKLLVRTGQDLCLGCHDEMANTLKEAVKHPPLEDGCTGCHNPHGTNFPKLLSAQGQDVCFECHDDISEKVTQARVVHEAIKKKGCVACHNPHASENEGLLRRPQIPTCLGCHDKIPSARMKVLHGKHNEGKCSDCHDPHGSSFDKLLVGEYPMDTYVAYDGTQFGLCFKCHNRDMVAYPDTSFSTNFRDGERNLHYLHVNNRTKGRNCLLCHSQHGSDNPKIIADTVPFGKWQMPLKFVKTDTGGSCSPGCHRQQTYDRKNPGKKPVSQGQ